MRKLLLTSVVLLVGPDTVVQVRCLLPLYITH